MNRRQFLRHTTAATATAVGGSAFSFAFGQARADGCGGPPAGVQLFTIRDALQRDPRAALASLREIGIAEAELYGLNGAQTTLFGMAAADLKKAFDANGIRVELSHIGALTDTQAIGATARALGVRTVIVATIVPGESRAQLDALAATLNRVGREYRDQGLTFGCHNHDDEFLPVEGLVPFDYLMSNTDPDLVKIELDIGWLAYAGIDPVTYLRRYGRRVIACHLKDHDPTIATDVPARKLVTPGAGTIDFGAVLAAMNATGVAHGFLEVDVSDDPLGDVRRGTAHLQMLKGCA
jgi:sugar phosphate isomerase/epimerase